MDLNSPVLEASRLNELEKVLQNELITSLMGKVPGEIRKDLHREVGKICYLYEIVESLRGSYNDEGIRRWFQRERCQLEGKSPLEYLGSGWSHEQEEAKRVLQLARSSVDPGAT